MNGTQRPATGTFGAAPAKSAHKGGTRTLGRTVAPASTELLTFVATDLAPLPATGAPDNLLLGGDAPTSTEGRDLVLTLTYPADSEPEQDDTVQLMIDGVDLPAMTVTFDGSTNDVTLTLPAAAHAVAGRHTLGYHMIFVSGGGNDEYGPNQSFIVDYNPPGFPDLSDIEFGFDPSEGLTPERLDANGDLPAHVFGYSGLAIDDRIILIIDNVENAASAVVDHIPAPGDPILVTYPKTMIDTLADGPHEFVYRIEDRAGNKSPLAAPVTMTSLIRGFINDLVAPIVEQSAAPLVDDATARSDGGVTVGIPANPKLNQTYTAIIHWGSAESDPFAIPAGAQDPVASRIIPYGTVYAEWFATSAGGDQAVPVEVWYEVFLNGIHAGDSPKVPVDVNLYLAGGTDPDPETPVHESLVAPTVKSSSGATDNVIPIEDFDKDGTVVVPFLTTATPGPAVAAFIAGDIITVQYGTAAPFTYTVTQADVDVATDISIVLLAASIAAAGTGTIPAAYTITRALAGGDGSGTNLSLSPAQPVTVSSSGELPGGGATLAAATWSNAGGKTTVGPVEARAGVDIEMPLYSNKKEGDFITVSLEMFPRFSHTDGELPIVPARTASQTHTVGAVDVGTPSTVTFNYDELMYFGQAPLTMHAHISYKVVGAGAAVEVGSDVLYVRVDCRGEEP
ncbi:hypothetical protein QFZ41_000303 [Luteibacter sp. W1I16]|uniref:hypothetical protein n=1 Tax=Luteibacter sp. W1I16 TaxID=3373922 RepID=UPI003D198705